MTTAASRTATLTSSMTSPANSTATKTATTNTTHTATNTATTATTAKSYVPLQTLKGFRDILPEDKQQRDWVWQQIRQAFVMAGFVPLDTPTLEYKETIMGKYGDEADKLVYQFVDNGGRAVALRYDQTVPTARVIAQYQSQLAFPFRRYQMQNVFRADKPQKGRYREFTQCDIDIFGSTGALADAEILATTYAAYKNIGFPQLELRVNDRVTLQELLTPFATSAVSVTSIIQSIDKLDKMSAEAVQAELESKGLDSVAATQVMTVLSSAQPSGNLQDIMRLAQALGIPESVLVFTPTLARGLDYYTGLIFEVIAPDYGAGSLGGGGRYDQLIADLSGVSMPAVGVAFGFDRTVEAANQLGLIPNTTSGAQVLVTVFDQDSQAISAEFTGNLRALGVRTELYPGTDKLAKQLKFAHKKHIPYVAILGPDENTHGVVLLKDMRSGEQFTLPRQAVSREMFGE